MGRHARRQRENPTSTSGPFHEKTACPPASACLQPCRGESAGSRDAACQTAVDAERRHLGVRPCAGHRGGRAGRLHLLLVHQSAGEVRFRRQPGRHAGRLDRPSGGPGFQSGRRQGLRITGVQEGQGLLHRRDRRGPARPGRHRGRFIGHLPHRLSSRGRRRLCRRREWRRALRRRRWTLPRRCRRLPRSPVRLLGHRRRGFRPGVRPHRRAAISHRRLWHLRQHPAYRQRPPGAAAIRHRRLGPPCQPTQRNRAAPQRSCGGGRQVLRAHRQHELRRAEPVLRRDAAALVHGGVPGQEAGVP